jgi:hypothetical protein
VDDLDFELVASSLRADASDLRTFTEALATKLEGALPNQTTVQRKAEGLFSKTKRVQHISVDVGDQRYDLSVRGAGLECRRSKSVRGIVLKTEQVPLDEWIDDLSRQLAEAAQRSEQARLALQRLLGA